MVDKKKPDRDREIPDRDLEAEDEKEDVPPGRTDDTDDEKELERPKAVVW